MNATSHRVSRLALAAALAGAVGLACAQTPPKSLEKPPQLDAVPEPPDVNAVNKDDGTEPTVTIRQDESNSKIEEYRVHGKLYAVRVTPKVGAPYTMVDPDGTGTMVRADDRAGVSVRPPRWVLFEF